jgi:type I restriction enzyme R subunit
MDREVIRRRHLPHWDVPNAMYFVTTCLEGSIPAQGLLELTRFRAELRRRPKPAHLTEEEWGSHRWKLNFACLEEWLDRQPARRVLEEPALAQAVVDSMYHFAGERYDLFAYVVMPSHLHWLFQPLSAWVETDTDPYRTPRERITYSLNRFTGTRCNRLLRVNGSFWQTESYDHWVRDVDELERIIRYIEENPVKAGLVETAEQWRFSSAWARKLKGTAWGIPLRKPCPKGHADVG